MKIRTIIILLAITFTAAAGPARKGRTILMQPDGTAIEAILRGDEFTRIKTTIGGHAIMQNEEGWWCYALFDSDGSRYSSGYKVGDDAPAAILFESKVIPYHAIAGIAERIRNTVPLKAEAENFRNTYIRAETKAGPVTRHALVILAQFRDVSFKHSKEDFERLLLEEGYSVNGATGCAKEYFDAQFEGKIDFDFQVSDIITLPRNRAYYGSNNADGQDKAPAEMVSEACKEADSSIDFSQFDDDGDGRVDNIFVFFAGEDEAEGADEECVWSHAWYVYSGAGIKLDLDGKAIDRYACTAELTRTYTGSGVTVRLSGIGTFCHEYSHTFGLPDFYDTDYDERGGWAAGLWGNTSLMDSGNQNNHGNTPPYFNAIERELLGLNEPEVLEKAGTYRMSPIGKGGGFYRINTDTEDEYYLLECREEAGWDSYIGGSGMLIYHIDRSQEVLKKWISSNDLNADFTHQCADLIEADSRVDSFSDSQDLYDRTRNLKGLFFPYNDVTSFTNESSPGIKFWSGRMSTWGITAIKKEGKDIKFNFVDENAIAAPPSPINMAYRSFADAAIINFESSYVYDGEAVLTWKRTGQEGETISIAPYKPGKYCVILEGLEPGGKTYDVEVHFAAEGMEGESGKISFMTKRMPPVEWPYIYLTGSPKNSNGTFSKGTRIPLRVYNAGDAAEIIWYFNGRQVTHEGDGYYTLEKNGTLKAEVLWEDGSKEVIVKEITIGS